MKNKFLAVVDFTGYVLAGLCIAWASAWAFNKILQGVEWLHSAGAI